jgi:hypothetical protein
MYDPTDERAEWEGGWPEDDEEINMFPTISTEVRLPKQYVPCPRCGLHYVFPGKDSVVLCNMITDVKFASD